MDRRAPRKPPHRPRRIAFTGAVHAHKGSLVFEEAVRILERSHPGRFEWHAFGGGDRPTLLRWRSIPRMKVHGYYRAEDLPARLTAAKIDLAVVPSIWPETHCLVLDECSSVGVPVLAFDLGAIAARVRELDLGILVPPEAGAPGLAAAIAALG